MPKRKPLKFKAAEHTISDEQAQRIGSLIQKEAIRTPGELVDRAKLKRSPIHEDFEWDDEKAGHNYRIAQARKYFRCIVCILPDEDGEVKAFHSVSLSFNEIEEEADAERKYENYEEVLEKLSSKKSVSDQRYKLIAAHCKVIEDLKLHIQNGFPEAIAAKWKNIINAVKKNNVLE